MIAAQACSASHPKADIRTVRFAHLANVGFVHLADVSGNNQWLHQYNHVRQGVPLATAQAEADKFSGHSLRVGFATTAAESGADLRVISSVTRHKTMEMPRRYAQRADQLKTSPHNLASVGLERRRLRGSDPA